jgi:LTXXQ motif family protein
MLMKRSAFIPLLGLALCAAPALAQGPGPGGPMPGGPGMMMMRDGPGPDPAGMLLAATGHLHLTDAQVVRLAAIARRAEERHAAMRTSMQAAHADAAARQAPPDAEMARMHQQMEQLHQQAQADLRDALAVLTPDQQAMAFEMVAHHAGGHGPGGPGMMMRHPGGGPPPREGDAPHPPHPDAR